LNARAEHPRQELLDLIDRAERELSSQAWWTSRRRKDLSRRRYSQYMLFELRLHVGNGELGPDSVSRLVARLLDPDAGTRRHVAGHSVAFKRENRILWVDVPGAATPLEASREARESERGKALLAAGFREYGVSAMVEFRIGGESGVAPPTDGEPPDDADAAPAPR